MLGLVALETLLLWTLIFWGLIAGSLPSLHLAVLAAAAVVLVPAVGWDLVQRWRGPAVVWWRVVLVVALLAVSAVAGSVWPEIYSTLSRSEHPGFFLDPATTWATVAVTILGPVLAVVAIRTSKSHLNEESGSPDAVSKRSTRS
jgi:hypothetical protein